LQCFLNLAHDPSWYDGDTEILVDDINTFFPPAPVTAYYDPVETPQESIDGNGNDAEGPKGAGYHCREPAAWQTCTELLSYDLTSLVATTATRDGESISVQPQSSPARTPGSPSLIPVVGFQASYDSFLGPALKNPFSYFDDFDGATDLGLIEVDAANTDVPDGNAILPRAPPSDVRDDSDVSTSQRLNSWSSTGIGIATHMFPQVLLSNHLTASSPNLYGSSPGLAPTPSSTSTSRDLPESQLTPYSSGVGTHRTDPSASSPVPSPFEGSQVQPPGRISSKRTRHATSSLKRPVPRSLAPHAPTHLCAASAIARGAQAGVREGLRRALLQYAGFPGSPLPPSPRQQRPFACAGVPMRLL